MNVQRFRSDRRGRRDGGLTFGSIVHVNEKGGSFGGTEEYIALVTSALASRGVRSHLVCGVVSGVLRTVSNRCTSSRRSPRAIRSPVLASSSPV